MRWAPLLLLGACSPSVEMQTSPDAPWTFEPRTALWSVPPETTWREGVALLVVTDQDLRCADVAEADGPWELPGLVSSGTGLVFVLYRRYYEDPPLLGIEWEGLYLGGLGYDTWAYGERGLTTTAFREGTVVPLSELGDAASWVRVDWVGTGLVRGEFFARWWRGRFRAEQCSGGGVVDTGWWDTGG